MRLPPEDQMMTEVRGASNTRPSAGRNRVARADQLDPSGCTRSWRVVAPLEVNGGPGALFSRRTATADRRVRARYRGRRDHERQLDRQSRTSGQSPTSGRYCGLRDDGPCEPLSPRSCLVEVLAPRVAFSASLVVRLGVERRIAPAVDLSGGGELSAIDIATRIP